jgi:hypothetical protein
MFNLTFRSDPEPLAFVSKETIPLVTLAAQPIRTPLTEAAVPMHKYPPTAIGLVASYLA